MVKLRAPRPPQEPWTGHSLDQFATRLVEALSLAVKAAGKRPNKGGRSAPWWNDECLKARRRFEDALELGDARHERHSFKRAVRKAKRSYWERQVESAATDRDIFRITGWHRLESKFQPPPIQHDGNDYTDPLDRANCLRDSLLFRRSAADDLPTDCPTVPSREIPWDTSVSLAEATKYTIGAGNTAPGSDGITVRLLQAAWKAIGSSVRALFQGCLELGHFPDCFKLAEVVMLPKPGKKDMSSPKSWRPISLLSCLGKGLERLIAKRLAHSAVTFGVLAKQQFGALPKRSATDLVGCVVHDVEQALRMRNSASFLTLDVQGAFDCVLRNRLLLRLRQQSWPHGLVRWIQSFLTNRRVKVRAGAVCTDERVLECGLPQGSPLSPILFMLYIAPIFELGPPGTIFGYADDIAILRTGTSLTTTTELLQTDLARIQRWGIENAVSFAPDKSELLHLSRRRDRNELPAVVTQNASIEPSVGPVRWLGVWLDSRLDFRTHVEFWSQRAMKVSTHLRQLNRIAKGAPSHALAKAAAACVSSVVCFGAEAWWPGLESTNRSGKASATQVRGLLERIDRPLKAAARAVLPVWRTTPIPILHRESGLLPAEVLFESMQLRHAARIQSLDDSHPLRSRALAEKVGTRKPIHHPERHHSRLQRAARRVPWVADPPPLTISIPNPLPNPQTKEEAAAEFERWLKDLGPEAIVAYSDGSKSTDGSAGWGFVVQRAGLTIASDKGRLGPAEVYDAEAKGAASALEAALRHRTDDNTPIFVCLDNQSVLQGLRGGSRSSSHDAFRQFDELCREARVETRWSPGHMGILGNELADNLAKAGATLQPPAEARHTLAAVRREARLGTRRLIDKWWEESAPRRYQDLGLSFAKGRPPELWLRRPLLHHLIAARSGHGNFAAYHRRFGHDDIEAKCECGREKSPEHPFLCRRFRRHLPRGLHPSEAIDLLLGPKGHKAFDNFATNSGCFSLPAAAG